MSYTRVLSWMHDRKSYAFVKKAASTTDANRDFWAGYSAAIREGLEFLRTIEAEKEQSFGRIR